MVLARFPRVTIPWNRDRDRGSPAAHTFDQHATSKRLGPFPHAEHSERRQARNFRRPDALAVISNRQCDAPGSWFERHFDMARSRMFGHIAQYFLKNAEYRRGALRR